MHKISMTDMLSLLAVAVAAASMLFAGLQTRSVRRQTILMQAASELTFNLEVMMRLQEVLLRVADDPGTLTLVWHDQRGANGRPQIAAQSILDVLSMALKAVERLPGFSQNNGEDWISYTKYVLESSPKLRWEVSNHPEWWPEVTPYLEGMDSAD